MDQRTSGLKHAGRLVIMYSGFPTLRLVSDAKRLWRTQIIATQHGNAAHVPSSHKANIKASRSFIWVFTKSLHNGNLDITYWNSNIVIFLDNDIQSGQEHWIPTQVNQGAEKIIINLPLVA